MEGRLVQGATVFEEKEREQAQAQRKLAIELEAEKKRQKNLLEEQERMEEELIEKDRHYNSLQDEVTESRKLIKKLRQKYKQANSELKDIHQEHADQNEELLATVREQAKELDFLNQVTNFLLTDEHLYKIKDRTEWDEERRRHKLPTFQLKQKEVSFPKLG